MTHIANVLEAGPPHGLCPLPGEPVSACADPALPGLPLRGATSAGPRSSRLRPPGSDVRCCPKIDLIPSNSI